MKKRNLIIGLYIIAGCCAEAQYPSIRQSVSPFVPTSSGHYNNPYPFGLQQSYGIKTAADILGESDRELEAEIQRQILALSLAREGFPSRSRMPGTEYFYQAYEQLNGMLTDSIPTDLGKAVFLVENALLDNTLDYKTFQKDINERADLCRWKMQEEKLSVTDNMAKNKVLFQLFTEAMTVKQPGTEKKITHYPVQYNLEDYQSKKDFTSHFITTLLSTNKGQCYSMPILYLIVAEKLGTEAYFSYSPNHSFIKIKDDHGRWYNLELTCRSILDDSHYMNNSRIKSAAIRSGLYLAPMGKKDVIASMMTQLGHYYYVKYNHDPFVLKCMQQAGKYMKVPVDAWRVEADYENKLVFSLIKLLRIEGMDQMKEYYPEVYRHYARLQELNRKIEESGYEELPPEVYQQWLDHIQKLKEEEQRHPQSPIRKITR